MANRLDWKFYVVSWIIIYCMTSSFVVTALLFALTLWLMRKYSVAPPPAEAALQILGGTDTPTVIAHRAGGHDAPENTLAALKMAVQHGAKAVEFDVDYTSDGVAIVFHDDTVDRCTDGSGLVSNLTFAEIRKLCASAKHPTASKYPDERIPTLEEFVSACLNAGLKMYIDVKTNAKKSTEVLVELFQRRPELYKQAIVCSFNPHIIYSVRRRDSNIVCGLTHRSHYLTRKVDGTEKQGNMIKKCVFPLLDLLLQWSHHHWLWYLCGSSAFLTNISDLPAMMVTEFKQRGIQVVVWTVNSPAEREFCKHLGCPYITDTMNKEGCTVQKH